MPQEAPTIHALLIGIDYYEPNKLYRSLKGCVRDINLVQDFLKKSLQIPEEHIRKLTSPNVTENTRTLPKPALPSTDENHLLPTYENIVHAFQEITETAQSQDIIYIHYSGHGGRATTLYPELKGEGQSDEGIVPMDIGQQNGRYLRDVELATLLKRMTEKGLLVTIVLDSCHSGGATRGDCAIRGSGEKDYKSRPTESLVASREELINNWQLLTAGTHRTCWVPESKEYVLLAACRPTEFAYEYAVNGKERHGALTYWMIDTLSTIPETLTYKTLYERVRAKIQSKFATQSPMLLGEGDRAVFGGKTILTLHTVAVTTVDMNRKQVQLNAGLANGLSSGTRFAIYPLNTSDFTDKQKQLAIVEVTDDIKASNAYARILDPGEGGIVVKPIEQGSPAVILSPPVDLIRRVRLFDQKQLGEAEHELPTQTLVDQQKTALEAVRKALVGNAWIKEVQGAEEGRYQVAVGRNGEYEICIGSSLQNLNPPLQINDVLAPKEVVKRLAHLAKYQAIQELNNPASELTNSLEFVLLDQKKQPFSNQSQITLKHGTLVYIRVENVSPQSLNIAVMDLKPTWAISQIPLQGISSAFFELVPQQSIEIPLTLTVPEGYGYRQFRKMFKLCATRGPADFQHLELPSIEELKNHREEPRRTLFVSAFGNLLKALGGNPQVAPPLTRTGVHEPDPRAAWVTKTIQVTIEQ
ncbi:MAG: caspase family protein [Leptolyngbyaceae cyanobacterium bins.59]|nr:caspase family protein [Leptolyngbyaceae cyanobacterium bins.59]